MGLVVVLAIISAIMSAFNGGGNTSTTSSDSTASVPQPIQAAAKPKRDWHAERQVAQDYWSRVIGMGAIANTALLVAGASVMNEDKVSAYQMLKNGAKYANSAANMAGENVPPGWDDVREHLSNAMSGFSSAYDRMADALDSDRTSDYAHAKDDAETARSEYGEAVHLARQHYVAMGGRWQDISDGSREQQSMIELLKAFAGPSQ